MRIDEPRIDPALAGLCGELIDVGLDSYGILRGLMNEEPDQKEFLAK